jgi:hypothetical protein
MNPQPSPLWLEVAQLAQEIEARFLAEAERAVAAEEAIGETHTEEAA